MASVVRFTSGQQQPQSRKQEASTSGTGALSGSILRNHDNGGGANNNNNGSIFRRFFKSAPQAHHTNNEGQSSVVAQQRRFNTGPNGGGGGQTGEEAEDHSTAGNGRCCVGYVGMFHPSRVTLDRMNAIIASRSWQMVLVFFTILLLFGEQFQELWVPKEGDIVFDILFTIALVVFVLDIILRCYVEPQYFGFGNRGSLLSNGASSRWGSFQVGSFMFWCDVISSATLLYDISYINRSLLQIKTIDIIIDSAGMPQDGLDEINRALPIELNPELLFTIGRTARVARFIRASTVVKTSSKVNWYWLYQRINPAWYWEKFRKRASHQLSNKSLDPEGENYTNANGTAATGPGIPGNKSKEPRQLVRHASWGGVQLGVLAAVKKAQMEEERKQMPQERGILGASKRFLRWIGLMMNDDEEVKRHIAATKIQRVWRATVNQHRPGSHQGSVEEMAWAPSTGGDSTVVDRVMQKRSILRQYNTTGGTKAGRNASKSKVGSNARRSMLPMSVKNQIARSNVGRRRPESQVGSAMRELTGQRVAIGIIIALVLTVLFSYSENDATRPSTMIVLHHQTVDPMFGEIALNAARRSSIPDLYRYKYCNDTIVNFTLKNENYERLRYREMLRVTVHNGTDKTMGYFAYRNERRDGALVELFSTIFILLVWFFGVTAFAGPVMTLVVIPIERMVRLLGMLMVDPLGYQSTPRYKKFVAEEDELTKNTRWTKEVLKGMETSFLMSTILRIGSLMKVGFGSAGVEIIRNNLERGQSKNMLLLNSKGSTVSCIFLFCDIRQFTDATECLQEEVFVFTNRIAAVVHSICHAFGGSANKNVGDAFLLSWLLEDETSKGEGRNGRRGITIPKTGASGNGDTFTAKSNQADKALLTVVKICMALHHDKFYIETMSETAREALLTKLSKRKGPVVQMGFGLHAGKAVQGAIGSQRKIDATYVSESVERAEFLESSTKKYGLKMLMSDNFHRLLHPSNRRRCRKVDQILLQNEDEDDEEAVYEGDVMELFTFDMDIDALWRTAPKKGSSDNNDNPSDTDSINESTKGSKREVLEKKASTRHVPGGLLKGPRRRSMNRMNKPSTGDNSSEEFKSGGASSTAEAVAAAAATVAAGSTEFGHGDEASTRPMPPELVLPTGPTLYNANVWLNDDMRKIRELFSNGLFFQKFNSGLQSYYARDWEHARQCFLTILERCDDGPSRYFLKCIEDNNGIPPRNFLGYGTA